MSKYKLGTPQNVSKNKIVLEQKDILDKTVEGFYFLDPVFQKRSCVDPPVHTDITRTKKEERIHNIIEVSDGEPSFTL